DPGHMAGEGLVFEGLHADAGRLPKINLPNVALIHLALDVHFAGITQRHHQSGSGTEHQDGADRVANLHVARQHNPVNWGDNRRIAELLLELLQAGFVFLYLGLGLRDLRLVHHQLGTGHIALVDGEDVVPLRVVEGALRNNAVLEHLLRTLVGALQSGNFHALSVDLSPLFIGLGALEVGLGGEQLRAGRVHLRLDLYPVELRQDLALFHRGAGFYVELGDDAAGFGLDLDLGDGRDFTG